MTDLNTLISDYLTYLELNGRAPGTVTYYRYGLTKFAAHLATRSLDLTAENAVRFVLGLEGKAEATRASWLRMIRAFWNWADDERRLPSWPRKLKPKFGKPPKRLAPSRDQVFDILNAMPQRTSAQRRNRVLMWFLYFTGSRISEGVSLRRGMINLERHVVQVYARKTREFRLIPLIPQLESALGDWLKKVEGDWVFPSLRSPAPAPVDRHTILDYWQAHQAALGIESPITLHDLRRAFATHSLRSGVDSFMTKENLGHADIKTTLVYISSDLEARREALVRVWPETHSEGAKS